MFTHCFIRFPVFRADNNKHTTVCRRMCAALLEAFAKRTAVKGKEIIELRSMDIVNGSDQVDRAISTGKLHALPHFHTRPINVVVFHGSDREYSFSGGFPA